MVAILAKRREHAGHHTNDREERSVVGAALLYLGAIVFGAWSLYEVVYRGWGNKAMQVFVYAAFGLHCVASILFGVMAIHGVKFEQHMRTPPVGEACGLWAVGMVLVSVAALPFVMDIALAIGVGNVWGVQMGKTTEIVALYAAYITACALPALVAYRLGNPTVPWRYARHGAISTRRQKERV
jgi:hypothetical protein